MPNPHGSEEQAFREIQEIGFYFDSSNVWISSAALGNPKALLEADFKMKNSQRIRD